MGRHFLIGNLFVLICCSIAFGTDGTALEAPSECSKVDRILVEKSKRRLVLFSDNKILRVYHIALGKNPVGPKIREGDGKTPEGVYYIDYRNSNSRYHLSLHISYPNAGDRLKAEQLGVQPGGDIMIHGLKNGLKMSGSFHRFVDWTDGCVAVTNHEIEELWELVPDGTPIEIKP